VFTNMVEVKFVNLTKHMQTTSHLYLFRDFSPSATTHNQQRYRRAKISKFFAIHGGAAR